MKGKHNRDIIWGRAVLDARKSFGRDNVGFVYGRHHVEAVQHEGAERNASVIGDADCATCNGNGHRCIGRYGGFPDLSAFDMAEWLWTGMDSLNHTYLPRPFIKYLGE